MPQTTQEKSRINRVLGSYGLPQLGASGLNEALAFLVCQDSDPERFFRDLLNKCEPSERPAMYESLRPHLSFTPKPLDVYISEMGELAERKQLPTITADGKLAPYNVPEIRTESLDAAISEALAKVHLTVACRKCTKAEVFHGKNRAEAIHEARMAGWTYNELDGSGREICPDCPVARN